MTFQIPLSRWSIIEIHKENKGTVIKRFFNRLLCLSTGIHSYWNCSRKVTVKVKFNTVVNSPDIKIPYNPQTLQKALFQGFIFYIFSVNLMSNIK